MVRINVLSSLIGWLGSLCRPKRNNTRKSAVADDLTVISRYERPFYSEFCHRTSDMPPRAD